MPHCLLQLSTDGILYDLGCGDGRLLTEAVKVSGACGVRMIIQLLLYTSLVRKGSTAGQLALQPVISMSRVIGVSFTSYAVCAMEPNMTNVGIEDEYMSRTKRNATRMSINVDWGLRR